MAERPAIYSGQGLSLRGEKGRFVLPPSFRKSIVDDSGERVLCLAQHHRWRCLSAFGLDRPAGFAELLEREDLKASRLGKDYDRDVRSGQLYTFTEVPFDASGRFILPDTLSELGEIDESIYFQSFGSTFALWNPAIVAEMGAGFENAQIYCRRALAEAGAKGGKK